MTIGHGTLYWQSCAKCGERWMGTHVCRKSALDQITGEMIRSGEKAVREGRFATLEQIKTELKLREEVEHLRAALREIASVVSLDTCSIPGCHMQKIRAIVERAAGGES